MKQAKCRITLIEIDSTDALDNNYKKNNSDTYCLNKLSKMWLQIDRKKNQLDFGFRIQAL